MSASSSSYGDDVEITGNVVHPSSKEVHGIEVTSVEAVEIVGNVIYPPLTWWDRLRLRLGLTVRGFRRG